MFSNVAPQSTSNRVVRKNMKAAATPKDSSVGTERMRRLRETVWARLSAEAVI